MTSVLASPAPPVEARFRFVPNHRLGAGRRLLRRLVFVGALTAATAGAFYAAASLVGAGPREAAAEAETPQGWIDVRRPIHAYDLAGTDFARLPLAYSVRRHREGGGRIDSMAFGEARPGAAFLQLALYRVGDEAEAVGDFAADLAQNVAHLGLGLTSPGRPSVVPTSFGPVEAARVALAGTAGRLSCVGFRGAPDRGTVFRLVGLLCPPSGSHGAAENPACVLDRLDLVAAADDPALQDVFVAAQRRRSGGCTASPLPLLPGSWLDAGDAPQLKGSAAARAEQD